MSQPSAAAADIRPATRSIAPVRVRMAGETERADEDNQQITRNFDAAVYVCLRSELLPISLCVHRPSLGLLCRHHRLHLASL